MNEDVVWKYRRLNDIASLVTGRTPAKDCPWYYASEGVPWAKIENLGQGPVRRTSKYLSQEGAAKVIVAPKGSTLVSVVGTVGKIGFADCDLATNQQIVSVVYKQTEQILPKYGYFYLLYSRKRIKKMAYFTIEKLVSSGTLGQLVIPLPSLETQEKLVHDFEAAEQYLELKREMATLINEYEKNHQGYWTTFKDPMVFKETLENLQQAAQEMVQKAEALRDSLFHAAFHECERRKNAYYLADRDYLQDRSELKELSAVANRFFHEMSDFQQRMYLEFYRQKAPVAIHCTLKKVKKDKAAFENYHIQDAVNTVEVFRELGLLQMQETRILSYPVDEDGKKEPVHDENGEPVGIELWDCLFTKEDN